MVLLMKKQIGLALIVSVIITGCGSDNIEKVRNSRSLNNDIYVIKDILDTRKSCKDVEWHEFEGDKSIKIVEYICHIDTSEDVKKFNEIIDTYKDVGKVELKEYNEFVSNKHKKLADLKEKLEKFKVMVTEEKQKGNGYADSAYAINNIEREISMAQDDLRYGGGKYKTEEESDQLGWYTAWKNAGTNYLYKQRQLVAQFTFVDDEKDPRIMFTGERGIVLDGSLDRSKEVDGKAYTRSIRTNDFFKDMEEDKNIGR